MRRLLTSILLASSFAFAACGSSSGETKTPASSAPATPAASATGACAPTGCSGTICAPVGQEMMSTCEYKPEYDCYKKASCAMQADGKCGWNKSAELDACIASAAGPAGVKAGDAPQ